VRTRNSRSAAEPSLPVLSPELPGVQFGKADLDIKLVAPQCLRGARRSAQSNVMLRMMELTAFLLSDAGACRRVWADGGRRRIQI
jgi:hypothetical protein